MTLTEAIASGRDRDERDTAICAVLGLTGPGGFALRATDGSLIVYQTEHSGAVYNSRTPITDREWDVVRALAWIEVATESQARWTGDKWQ
jgi:hypothetical protein